MIFFYRPFTTFLRESQAVHLNICQISLNTPAFSVYISERDIIIFLYNLPLTISFTCLRVGGGGQRISISLSFLSSKNAHIKAETHEENLHPQASPRPQRTALMRLRPQAPYYCLPFPLRLAPGREERKSIGVWNRSQPAVQRLTISKEGHSMPPHPAPS